jgi:hypothetical protein
MEKKVFLSEFENRLNDVKVLVESTNKSSVLIIQQIPKNNDLEPLIPKVRESLSNIICFVEIGDSLFVSDIIEKCDGIIDKIILDTDYKRDNSRQIIDSVEKTANKSILYYYSDFDIWANASTDFILQKEQSITGKTILILGNNYLSSRILINLLNRHANLYVLSEEYRNKEIKFNNNLTMEFCEKNINYLNQDQNIDIIVGCSVKRNNPNIQKYSGVSTKSVYDIGLNNFDKEFIEKTLNANVNVYRFDNRAGISSMVLKIMETDYLLKNHLGRVFINDIEIVSGGFMGGDGAIVVDNAFDPSVVLGVANGEGLFKYDLTVQDNENLMYINSIIE